MPGLRSRPLRTLALAALALTALSLAPLPAQADMVVLKNGETFTGALLREADDAVTLQVDGVEWTFPRASVTAVRRDGATREKELAKARTRGALREAGRARQAQDSVRDPVRDAGRVSERTEAARSPSVVVYGTSWCGFCRKARSYLQQRGIAFSDRDVEREPQAAAEVREKMLRAGMRPTGSVPVLDVNGTIILGFDVPAISEALSRGR